MFTPAYAILIGGAMTINVPSGYFATRTGAAALTILCARACPSAVVSSAVAVVNVAAVGTTPAFTQITVAVTSAPTTASAITLTFPLGVLATGTPQAATASGITVSTTQDFASAGHSASQALGGQVTVGASLTLVSYERVGLQATSCIVTIVFTPVTIIPSGGTITINTPFNYFATRTASAAAGTSTITCGTACAGDAVGNVRDEHSALHLSRSACLLLAHPLQLPA